MLFRRRDKASLRERFRTWLWPRVSWRRSGRYFLKRTVRLSGTPHAVAIGTAVGAAVSFTPFLGVHVLLSIALAWLLRGNLAAAAIGTFLGNPLTFPAIWGATYELGQFLLHGAATARAETFGLELAEKPVGHLLPMIMPMLAGSIPLGLAAACITYVAVYKAVSAYQQARRQRFAGRGRPDKMVSDLVESGRHP
jgi:uncharacterized protein (DUF2062 family)